MPIPFVKMHGLGNDYVYIDGFTHTVDDPSSLAQRVAERHFGIGSDGLILVLPPREGTGAHCRMRMFNADGSEGQMCGNGIRCLCKFAHDHALFPDARDVNPMRIETDNGVLSLDYTLGMTGWVEHVTVDMGEPRLDFSGIPVESAHTTPTELPYTSQVSAAGFGSFHATFVSTGNPHAVIFAENADAYRRFKSELGSLGKALEHHPAFPERANVHFVRVRDSGHADVLHWERGSGATLACGTGASAVCVAGVLTGRNGRKLKTNLPGGSLDLYWDQASNHVFMTGPATEVYRGVWPD